jgi:hypothetical protein
MDDAQRPQSVGPLGTILRKGAGNEKGGICLGLAHSRIV